MASTGDFLDGLVIGLHLVSAHSAPGLNNQNPGVYLRAPSGATAGFYENSISRTRFGGNNGRQRISTYAGWTWETSSQTWAISIAGVTGYGRDEQDVCVERTQFGGFGCARSEHLEAVPAVIPMVWLTGRWALADAWAARIGYTAAPAVTASDRYMHVMTLMMERSF